MRVHARRCVVGGQEKLVRKVPLDLLRPVGAAQKQPLRLGADSFLYRFQILGKVALFRKRPQREAQEACARRAPRRSCACSRNRVRPRSREGGALMHASGECAPMKTGLADQTITAGVYVQCSCIRMRRYCSSVEMRRGRGSTRLPFRVRLLLRLPRPQMLREGQEVKANFGGEGKWLRGRIERPVRGSARRRRGGTHLRPDRSILRGSASYHTRVIPCAQATGMARRCTANDK